MDNKSDNPEKDNLSDGWDNKSDNRKKLRKKLELFIKKKSPNLGKWAARINSHGLFSTIFSSAPFWRYPLFDPMAVNVLSLKKKKDMTTPLRNRQPNVMVATEWLSTCEYSTFTPIQPVSRVTLTPDARVQATPPQPSACDTFQPSTLLDELKKDVRLVAAHKARLIEERAALVVSEPQNTHTVEKIAVCDKALSDLDIQEAALMKSLMKSHETRSPILKAPSPSDSSSDSSSDDVPLSVLMAKHTASAIKPEVKGDEEVTAMPAAPSAGANDVKGEEGLAAVVAAPSAGTTRPEGHKHKYNKAKETLELRAHGGMKQWGRNPWGAPSLTSSGYKFNFTCCKADVLPGCPANGFINADYSVTVSATHRPPNKDASGAPVPGTGCERYGKFRGLHSSELEIVAAHDVNAASATCAKAVSNKIAASKLAAQRKAALIPPVEGQKVVEVFEKHTPSARSIRHTVTKAKGHCNVDLSSVGDITKHITEVWTGKHKDSTDPPPCEVVVVHTESWETAPLAPASRKTQKREEQANPDHADDVSPHRTRKTTRAPKEAPPRAPKDPAARAPKEAPKAYNSIIIFSTVVLMALCSGSSAASIDGTYRCAPGRSTIADFGVFVGRAFVPCFLGILTGPRSGDTSEHWRRFLMAVKHALGGWGPKTCVRDHASCLINALNDVWATCVQIVCYFHVRQCIRRKRSKMPVLLKYYKDIMKWVDMLHYTTSENWALARRVIDEKLPKSFRDYFFIKTLHGDGLPNEVWAHNLAHAGESMTNCAAERFHATLRMDPDMFNGVQKPGMMHAVGLLGIVVGAISFRCSVKSSLGGLLYTEHADTTQGTRVRNAWKAALHLVESGVLDETHSCARGTAFWFLSGGKKVSRAEVTHLTSRKGISAADYAAFFKLRRATVDNCQCIPFLKFGFCRHVYAVSIRLNGMKFVPHGVREGVRAVPESDVDVAEAGEREYDEASQSDSVPDTDGSEEAVAPAMTTQRSRRPAVIHNASEF